MHVMVAVTFLALFKFHLHETAVGQYLNLSALFRYYIYFALGVIAIMQHERFHQLVSNHYVQILIALIAFSNWLYPNMHWVVIGVSRVLLTYIIFYNMQGMIDSHNDDKGLFASPLNLLIWFGKSSLEIYFLNSFVMFQLPPCINEYLNWTANEVAYWGAGSVSFVEFLIVGGLTVLSMIACIWIKTIINQLPIASKLLFGR